MTTIRSLISSLYSLNQQSFFYKYKGSNSAEKKKIDVSTDNKEGWTVHAKHGFVVEVNV